MPSRQSGVPMSGRTTRSSARIQAAPPPFSPPIVEIQPILMDQGVLKINIQTDGQTVRPDFKTMTDNMWYIYPQAPIELSIWYWAAPDYNNNFKLIQSGRAGILENHVKVLYDSLDRWITARFDAALLNFLIHRTSWSLTPHPPARNLRHLGLLNVGEVGGLKHIDNLMREVCGTHGLCDLYIGDSVTSVPWLRRSLPGIGFSSLTCLKFDGFPFPAAEAHDLLTLMKGIQEFSVSDLTGPHTNEKHRVVNYSLRRLSLQVDMMDFEMNNNTCAVFGLLQYLCVPGLKELSLGYENKWDSGRFAELYRLMPPSLKKLRLKAMGMDKRELVQCLELNPGLEELTLDTQIDRWDGSPMPVLFTEKTCQRFLYNEHGDYLCPDLKKLAVRDNCVGRTASGCFSAMVQNRFKNGPLKAVAIVGDEPVLGDQDCHTLHHLKYRGLAFEYLRAI